MRRGGYFLRPSLKRLLRTGSEKEATAAAATVAKGQKTSGLNESFCSVSIFSLFPYCNQEIGQAKKGSNLASVLLQEEMPASHNPCRQTGELECGAQPNDEDDDRETMTTEKREYGS